MNNTLRPWNTAWLASCKEAGLLLLVSVIATGGWWALQDERLPLTANPAVYQLELAAPLLAVSDARQLYDEGIHLFVDTRAETDGMTIPGALFIREDTFDDDLRANFDFLFPEDQLILFGDGDLTRTSNVAARLIARGYTNVEILQGGLGAWQKAGGDTSPVTPGETP